MNWDLVLGVLGGLAAVFATSSAALSWAAKNGERLGRMLAKRIPGDGVERFLIDFLRGLERGLEAGIKVEVSPKPLGTDTEVKVRVQKSARDRTRTR